MHTSPENRFSGHVGASAAYDLQRMTRAGANRRWLRWISRWIALLVPFIPVCPGFGQSVPNWLDGFRCGGTGADRGFGVSSDGQGCSYLCGTFEGTVFMGGIAQASVGLSEILVAKVDYDGKWLWASRAGSTGFDGAQAIATDAAGNSYVAGGFTGTASFGPHRLTSKGGTDAFVAKLSPSGDCIWARSAGGTMGDEAYGIAVDGSGNCYPGRDPRVARPLSSVLVAVVSIRALHFVARDGRDFPHPCRRPCATARLLSPQGTAGRRIAAARQHVDLARIDPYFSTPSGPPSDLHGRAVGRVAALDCGESQRRITALDNGDVAS